jgi:hypothetical protein
MMPGIASGAVAMLPSSKRRVKFAIDYVSHRTAPVVASWRPASVPTSRAVWKRPTAWSWHGRGGMKVAQAGSGMAIRLMLAAMVLLACASTVRAAGCDLEQVMG